MNPLAKNFIEKNLVQLCSEVLALESQGYMRAGILHQLVGMMPLPVSEGLNISLAVAAVKKAAMEKTISLSVDYAVLQTKHDDLQNRFDHVNAKSKR